MKEPDLTESFNQQSRTWKNGAISARLDRFYIKKFYDDFNFQYFKHINFIKSDHNMVSIKIVLENNNSKVNKSINIWRLNDNILLNEDVSKEIIRICDDIKNYFDENNSFWYDKFISKITHQLKKESRRLNYEKNEYIRNLLRVNSSIFIDEWN